MLFSLPQFLFLPKYWLPTPLFFFFCFLVLFLGLLMLRFNKQNDTYWKEGIWISKYDLRRCLSPTHTHTYVHIHSYKPLLFPTQGLNSGTVLLNILYLFFTSPPSSSTVDVHLVLRKTWGPTRRIPFSEDQRDRGACRTGPSFRTCTSYVKNGWRRPLTQKWPSSVRRTEEIRVDNRPVPEVHLGYLLSLVGREVKSFLTW